MKITLHVENENPFAAGWLACHMGLPKDSLKLYDIDKRGWDEGWDTRNETADMDNPYAHGKHGGAHVAFLIEATNPTLVSFVRHKVSVTVDHVP